MTDQVAVAAVSYEEEERKRQLIEVTLAKRKAGNWTPLDQLEISAAMSGFSKSTVIVGLKSLELVAPVRGGFDCLGYTCPIGIAMTVYIICRNGVGEPW